MVKNTIKLPLALAGTSIGLSTLGSKLNFGGVVPDQISSNLSSAGTMTSSFISPAVNISAGAYIIKQLRGFKHGL